VSDELEPKAIEETEREEVSGMPEMSSRKLLVLTVAFEGGMLVVAVLLGYFLTIRFWEGQAVSVRALGLGTLVSIPLLVFVIGIAESSSKWGEQIRRDFVPVVAMFRNVTILDIAFISFMAGLCEEALFRGFGQNFLAGYIGEFFSLMLVSLVFGLVHWLSFSYFVFASVIGLYLGLLYIWTGDLIVPITTHAVYDFVALVYGTRYRPVQ
jgi:membrane protease YdiL (CAAX protease family)